jgi:hypothetical protein
MDKERGERELGERRQRVEEKQRRQSEEIRDRGDREMKR